MSSSDGAPPAHSSSVGAPPAHSSSVGAPPAHSSSVGAPPARPVKVTVQLPSLLLESTGGRREVEVEAATLQGCVEDLLARYPLLEIHLFEAGRELRGHVNLFHNDTNVRRLDDWSRPVRAGDTLTILQAVSGGAPEPRLQRGSGHAPAKDLKT